MRKFHDTVFSMIVNLFVVIASVAAATAIVLYATWLFAHRLKAEDSKAKSFGEWLRNVLEGIWGL